MLFCAENAIRKPKMCLARSEKQWKEETVIDRSMTLCLGNQRIWGEKSELSMHSPMQSVGYYLKGALEEIRHHVLQSLDQTNESRELKKFAKKNWSY